MNGREHQLSMEPIRGHGNAPEEGRGSGPDQAGATQEAFLFGPFRIVPHARLLERGGAPTSLSSRAFDLLCLLISRPGVVVSKGELLARAWPDLTVEESCLRFHITMLRRALGDRRGGERYVVNVPGRGYCFVASVGRQASPLKQSDENSASSTAPSVWVERQLAAV